MIKMVAHDRKNEKKTCIKNPKSSTQAVMQCLFAKHICHQLRPNNSSLFVSRTLECIVLVADVYIISLKVQGNFVLYTYRLCVIVSPLATICGIKNLGQNVYFKLITNISPRSQPPWISPPSL